MNPNEELGYVSSSPMLSVAREQPKPIDEAEISTLEQAFNLLENRRAYYQSVDSLSLEDKTFTMEQQLAINRKVLFHVQELESLLQGTINKVREKLDGRR